MTRLQIESSQHSNRIALTLHVSPYFLFLKKSSSPSSSPIPILLSTSIKRYYAAATLRNFAFCGDFAIAHMVTNAEILAPLQASLSMSLAAGQPLALSAAGGAQQQGSVVEITGSVPAKTVVMGSEEAPEAEPEQAMTLGDALLQLLLLSEVVANASDRAARELGTSHGVAFASLLSAEQGVPASIAEAAGAALVVLTDENPPCAETLRAGAGTQALASVKRAALGHPSMLARGLATAVLANVAGPQALVDDGAVLLTALAALIGSSAGAATDLATLPLPEEGKETPAAFAQWETATEAQLVALRCISNVLASDPTVRPLYPTHY
jgi:hypothetical protein